MGGKRREIISPHFSVDPADECPGSWGVQTPGLDLFVAKFLTFYANQFSFSICSSGPF